MFNTDKPIYGASEDKLGRRTFAKQLANAITQFDTQDTYAISLQGKWGCGKTSVLNMTIEEIKKFNEGERDKRRIEIVEFNPWNFTDTNQLVEQFFLTLSTSLNFKNTEQKLKNIGSIIETYSSALKYSEYIPMLGPYLKLIPNLAEKVGQTVQEKVDIKLNDVSYRKSKVEQALTELDFRVLVIIDDIDRLSNDQIKLIFQLVNTIAGFPNLTYLLSYDKEIVTRALSEVQNCNGEEYLEKIIQVPFDVPYISVSRIHNILREMLDELIEIHSGFEFDTYRWSIVFNACIYPFVRTLRDVHRYMNVFSFMYSSVKTEVDFIDMAGICSLKIFANPIYEWIRENRNSIVGGYNNNGFTINELKEREESMLSLFKEVYPQNPSLMFDSVVSLFPRNSSNNPFSTNLKTREELHQEMRIASDTKFDLYFSLSVDNIKISKAEILESIQRMNEVELREYVESLISRKLYVDYVYEVKYYLPTLADERLELLLSVLLFANGRIIDSEIDLLLRETYSLDIYTISEFLTNIGDETFRFDVVLNMFTKADFTTFQLLLELLHRIELTHGRIAETSAAYKPKLVDLDNLLKLEAVFLSKVKYFVTETNLFEWAELQRVWFMWEYIEESTYSEYIKEAIHSDLNAIKFLALHVGIWRSNGVAASFEIKNTSYSKYIDNNEIAKLLKRTKESKEYLMLEEKERNTLIAFDIMLESSETKTNIDIEYINERFDLWNQSN